MLSRYRVTAARALPPVGWSRVAFLRVLFVLAPRRALQSQLSGRLEHENQDFFFFLFCRELSQSLKTDILLCEITNQPLSR